jgi:Kef-type K+ transport system membrane component KefB
MIDSLFAGFSSSLFFQIGSIIILATLFAWFSRFFKQPLIPAYILAGILLGPIGFGIVQDEEIIKALSEMGIVFLLFIVGLEVDLNKLKTVGWVSSLGGIIQVLLTFVMGFLISKLIGFSDLVSIYAGLIFAFSSTMVVIKLLSDKGRINTLHGRIIIGILIIQDIFAIVALTLFTTFGSMASFSYDMLLIILVKGFLFILTAFLLSRYILKKLFNFAARSYELLFLSSLTICFLFALLALMFDFSVIIGAFIAGVVLASLPYNFDIIGRVVPLRDFFATIFFVSLGMQLVWINKSMLLPLFLFSFAIIVLKPIIITFLVSLFGYDKRVSFLSGVSLGQTSEFSLVMVSLGFYSLGHLSQEFFSLIVFLTIITIIVTSYVMKHDAFVYSSFSKPLSYLNKLSKNRKKLEYMKRKNYSIVLFGAHRIGNILVDTFKNLNKEFLIVDHNPEIINHFIDKRIHCLYGDASNVEILHRLKWKKTKILISTLPNENDNNFLIRYVKKVNPKIRIFVTANYIKRALDLYESGADYVIVPHVLGGKKFASILKNILNNPDKLVNIRTKHIKELLNVEIFGI